MFRFLCIAMDVLPAAIILLPVIVTFQITLWKPISVQRKIWMIIFTLYLAAVFGVVLSLAIELSQIFTYRLTDVDDLITNTLGAILGYYAAKVILKKTKTDTAVRGRCGELAVIIGSTLLVMFFAQPYISSWLWDMVI